MSGRAQSSARLLPAFTSESSAAERLAACKAYLAAESERIHQRHRAGEPGHKIAQALAGRMDRLLQPLFAAALASWRQEHGEPPSPVCLIALGGYGRGELSPLSDIDVMFLYPSKTKARRRKPLQEHLSNEILYPLWDCEAEESATPPARSTRPSPRPRATSDQDRAARVAPHRRLETLYENFAEAYRKLLPQRDPKGYIAIAPRRPSQPPREIRRHRLHAGARHQERRRRPARLPERPLDGARPKLGISGSTNSRSRNTCSPPTLRAFQPRLRVPPPRAQRAPLHEQASHRRAQPGDAARSPQNLGYTQKAVLARVEAFMQDYYRAAQTIYRTSKTRRSTASPSPSPPTPASSARSRIASSPAASDRTKRLDGFLLRGRELAAEHPDVFKEDPVRLIRVFRHCQQLGCAPDLDLAALIRGSLRSSPRGRHLARRQSQLSTHPLRVRRRCIRRWP
jgi:[protein-PII] uridylyltransferase